MNRIIYTAILLMLTLSGCEYHPYYDGQPFRVFNNSHGLIETDGTHIYVPIADRMPFKIEIYGGKGKNHNVTIADPEYLGFSYLKADVDGGFMGEGIIAATITLNPQALGETSMTITDEDTGESIQLYVHIVKAYRMMEVRSTRNSLKVGTVLGFEYMSKNDVVRIGWRNPSTGILEDVVDAKYRFLDYDTTVALELTYLADEDGQPDPAGTETVRRFLVQYDGGYDSGSPLQMMYSMNLDYLSFQTRAYMDDEVEYLSSLQFLDITDDENADPSLPETKVFFTRSAELGAWK